MDTPVAPQIAALDALPDAQAWLQIQEDLGLAPRTIDAYRRALVDYLHVCQTEGIEPLTAGPAEVARYVRHLRERPRTRGPKVVALDSGGGLANATIQQRLTAVRLFYAYPVEEQRRDDNPVGRGRYTLGKMVAAGRERGLVPRFTPLWSCPGSVESLRRGHQSVRVGQRASFQNDRGVWICGRPDT